MEQMIRLNKYISDCGICSRRQADVLIEQGKIIVDGVTANLGTKVLDESVVEYEGKRIRPVKKQVIYAYHKPIGLVCTSKEADKDSIFQKTTFPIQVNYVGRLDKDSSGLLLLTNDGELSNEIQKARNNHEKEYQVRVNRDLTEQFIENMQKGVPILDTVTKPCRVRKQGTRNFSIVLTQGMNRQIRRMCDYFGYRVVHLKSVRVMNVKLGDLRPGSFRELTPDEERKLRRLVNENNKSV